MKTRLRHRQRAQMLPLAMFGMLILTGALALVVDAGVFFVTQRQLQSAVDAAALAAVWYDPVCFGAAGLYGNPGDPSWLATGCNNIGPALPTPAPGWTCNPRPDQPADCVANAVMQENVGYAGALCRTLTPVPIGRTEVISGMTYYIMTVDCEAPYWFARIFPSISATIHIRAFARATIGYATPTGVGPTDPGATQHLVSRLVT